MPESLNITAGSMQDQSIAVYNYVVRNDDTKLRAMLSYPWVSKEGITTVKELSDYFIAREKDIVAIGEKYVTNIELYGCPTWYEWCNRYWGTKWNAGNPWTCENSFGLIHLFPIINESNITCEAGKSTPAANAAVVTTTDNFALSKSFSIFSFFLNA